MKAIEKEAKEYSNKKPSVFKVSANNGFIAGANSKTVDEMILKAIELVINPDEFSIYNRTKTEILEKVKQEFL